MSARAQQARPHPSTAPAAIWLVLAALAGAAVLVAAAVAAGAAPWQDVLLGVVALATGTGAGRRFGARERDVFVSTRTGAVLVAFLAALVLPSLVLAVLTVVLLALTHTGA